jgi:catechol 2,3-dioxygenase-like lactoylglutathione lyase family enzyme
MSDFSTSMLDHLNLGVSDVERSRSFYTAALGAIGIEELLSFGPEETASGTKIIGYGTGRKPFFWIVDGQRVGEKTHVAFAVDSRAQVQTFYKAALSAGGTDNGAPGLRTEYHDNYYGAFVLDPDGVNVEAVYHGTERVLHSP